MTYINKIFKFLLILLPVISCKKLDKIGFKTYSIKKGRHSSGFHYKSDYKETIEFDVIFDESSIYETEDPVNQADINKLYGVSDGGSHHMESSIRIGWRWYNNNLELLWFKHELGELSYGLIETIDVNKTYRCKIELKSNTYEISVDNKKVSTPRLFKGVYKHYYLYPYFGGDERAPHNISIKIKTKR